MSEYTAEEKLAYFRDAYEKSQNGLMDVEKARSGAYSDEMNRLAMLRFRFEEHPESEELRAYYDALGITRLYFDDGDFYSRYVLFLPKDIPAGKKLPVLFWNHGGGNDIITDEFSIDICRMAAEEQLIVCMLQNTNWESVSAHLDTILADYPADPERVYLMGYSQGGQTVHTALLNMPERLAAAAPCGAEAFCLIDNLNRRYTLEQLEHLAEYRVPTIQVSGCCEFLQYLPMNEWKPNFMNPGGHSPNRWISERNRPSADPTNPPDNGRPDKPLPLLAGTDRDRWKLGRLNLRLAAQGCRPRDADRCMGYRSLPSGDPHRLMGFYGDSERTEEYFGVKHYIYDFFDDGGVNTYRYVGVDNAPHWPLLMMARLCWDYMKQFRRDLATGRSVVDPYRAG